MSELINSADLYPEKIQRTLFNRPYSEEATYGKDYYLGNSLGKQGKDPVTIGIEQNIDWTKRPFSYKWNNLGLRGPDIEFEKEHLVFAGGSLCLGCGVPEEETFAHKVSKKLNKPYINISSADSLEELLDPLKDIAIKLNPKILVICDTRFVQNISWILKDLLNHEHLSSEEKIKFRDKFKSSDKRFLSLFESAVHDLFPESKIIFLTTPRKAFLNIDTSFKYFKHIELNKKLLVDLARDCVHPGPESHSNIAEMLYTSII